MRRYTLSRISLMLLLTFILFTYSCSQKKTASIFQTSTIDALIAGVYDGDFTFGELRAKGDFGLGTFNHLDGEMIGLDGIFYQVKSDGSVHIVPDSMKTPFSAVTFFKSDKVETIDKPLSCKELKEHLVSIFPTKNISYGIKVTGDFSYIKVRSVPEQEKPYPPLTQVVKEESKFEYENVKGTIVGFWLPGYLKNVNVVGFHFHFVSTDQKAGGHVLECNLGNSIVEIDYIRGIEISLPDTQAFNKADLENIESEDVKDVEGKKK